MKKSFFLFTICLVAFASFSQNASIKKQQFQGYFTQADSNYILVPISWSSIGKSGDMKIQTDYYYNYKNIIFYNVHNDSCRYLFADSLQIIDWIYYLNIVPNTREYLYEGNLLYKVTNDDYNRDATLGNDDPQYLYASNADGTGLQLITPRYHHVKDFEYFSKEKIILAILIQDSNGDKKFNNDDTEILYKIDLSDFSKSKVLVNLQIKPGGN